MSRLYKYSVRPVSKSVAEKVVAAKHYRQTLGVFWEGFGLFDSDDALVGVVCYGQPSPPIQKHAFENRDFRLYEMTRLVLDEGLFNGASTLIGQSLKQLSSQPCAVVSYADTGMGHIGTVYQATNWVYTGPVKAHDAFYRVNGELLHPTTVRDRFKVTNPKAWAKANGIEIVRPQPKHRYFQFVGSRPEKARMRDRLRYEEVRPYPKGAKRMYDTGIWACRDLVQMGHQKGLFEDWVS